jgi:hypothetical protein
VLTRIFIDTLFVIALINRLTAGINIINKRSTWRRSLKATLYS